MTIAPSISGMPKKISAIRLMHGVESSRRRSQPARPKTPPMTTVPSAEKTPTRIEARAP